MSVFQIKKKVNRKHIVLKATEAEVNAVNEMAEVMNSSISDVIRTALSDLYKKVIGNKQ